jgi:SAM-dependent methyltransferase
MSDWDEASKDYESHWEPTTGFVVDRLVDYLAPVDGASIVDAAAGPGTVTVRLAALGARVLASDFSEAMVTRLTARAAELGLSTLVDARVADAQSLPYAAGAADAAVSNFGIIFAPDYARAISELARVTRRGGRLAMSAWSLESRNGWTTLLGDDYEAELGFELGPRPAYRWKSRDDFVATLTDAGWSDVDVETIEFPLSVFASADEVVHSLESPATKLALAKVPHEQVDALRRYLVSRARARYGDGEVALPREAWLARGVA